MKLEINLYKESRIRSLVLAFSIIIIIISLFTYGTYWYFTHDLPDLTKITGYRPYLATDIYSSDGQLIGEFGTERRRLIPYEEVPPHVRNAFIAVEDKRFFEHKGLDLKRIVGALLKNIKEGEIVQGGSTITQQVVKNLVLSPERSIRRKIKEAILAYRMEKNLSKEEILYIYFNHIYFGDGTYGIEAASRGYFGKSATEINLAEAAFLAALPKAPAYYYPREHFDRAKERQELILNIMEEEGFTNKEETAQAKDYKIKLVPRRNINLEVAPYFIELVRQYIKGKYGSKALIEGGYTVFTTLDVDLSLAGTWALKRGILELESRQGNPFVIKHLNNQKEIDAYQRSQNINSLEKDKSYQGVILDIKKDNSNTFTATIGVGNHVGNLKFIVSSPLRKTVQGPENTLSNNKYPRFYRYDEAGLLPYELLIGDIVRVKVLKQEKDNYIMSLDFIPESQGALLAMDVSSGEIKAMIGGFDFVDSQFNRVTQALRQPGSSFKPIVYAAAIDKGYTETTFVYDTPVSLKDWVPQNYDGNYLGEISMRAALAKSRNLASVRIIMDINPSYAVRYAKKLGFISHLSPYPALALGGSDVRLIEMVKAFNVFASGGRLIEPKFILRIYDRDGRLIEEGTTWKYVSKEEAEKAEREQKRLDILNQIARSIGRSIFTKQSGSKEDSSTENNLDDNAKNEFLTPKEYLKLLQTGDSKRLTSSKIGEQVISPETAYIMTDMLQAVIKEGTGRGAIELNSLAPVAGKTGTTNDFTDAWFIGFSPKIIAGVWIGRDNHKSIGEGEVGGKAALPIWADFMKDALSKYQSGNFKIPGRIQFVSTPYGFIPYRFDSVPERVDSGDTGNNITEETTSTSGSEIDFLIRH
jgi:penicillin-binding protein 1A